MAGFQLTEQIPRPPHEVFDFVSSPENAQRSVRSVTRMVTITDGPIGVGTRFRETRVMRGREHDAELEVVEYEPDRTYALRNVTEGIETVYRYAFHSEADGTRVDLTCEVTASGARRLMVPVVVAVLRREDGDHLRRVKQALES